MTENFSEFYNATLSVQPVQNTDGAGDATYEAAYTVPCYHVFEEKVTIVETDKVIRTTETCYCGKEAETVTEADLITFEGRARTRTKVEKFWDDEQQLAVVVVRF